MAKRKDEKLSLKKLEAYWKKVEDPQYYTSLRFCSPSSSWKYLDEGVDWKPFTKDGRTKSGGTTFVR